MSTHCTRRAFDGCHGGQSCRNCPGEPSEPGEPVAAIEAEPPRIGERWLVALIIITAVAGGAVGQHSFERVERADQTARV